MKETIPKLSFDQIVDRLLRLEKPYHSNYLAMYSSWFGGIVTEPALMMVPVDDHLVHRGDGIFEALKCVDWKVYNLERHLDRLEYSAKGVQMPLRFDRLQLSELILATIRAGNSPDAMVRLYYSRGPGGFTASPAECPETQLYIVVTTLDKPSPEKYERGVKIVTSRIPLKQDYFAKIKSCNYLPNVLMRKEAEDAGADFSVSMDENGYLAEGPTENIGIVTRQREFLVPRFERILRGTTVSRACELARELIATGELTKVAEADITREEAYEAAEVMMFGTSFDLLPVVDYDGQKIGEGRPGPVAKRLLELFASDIAASEEMTTPVKEFENA